MLFQIEKHSSLSVLQTAKIYNWFWFRFIPDRRYTLLKVLKGKRQTR